MSIRKYLLILEGVLVVAYIGLSVKMELMNRKRHRQYTTRTRLINIYKNMK